MLRFIVLAIILAALGACDLCCSECDRDAAPALPADAAPSPDADCSLCDTGDPDPPDGGMACPPECHR